MASKKDSKIPSLGTETDLEPSNDRLFWIILSIGFLIRIWVACTRLDMIWPDEHFQTLEPAATVVFGHGVKSWEWQQGFRNWFVPVIYMPIFFVCKLFGCTGGRWPILLSRVLMVSGWVWATLGIHRITKMLSFTSEARFVVMISYLFSVPMILWSATTLSDNLALIIMWGLLPHILSKLESSKSNDAFQAGLLAGMPFLIRPQMSFWILGLAITGIMLRVPFKRLAVSALGALVPFLVYGLIDAFTWGVPFFSLWNQIFKGLEVSEFYGTAPWYAYLFRIWDDFGSTFSVFLGTTGVLAIGYGSGHQSRRFAWVTLPFAYLFIAHSFLSHKETRFILPMFPVFYLFLGWSVSRLSWIWNDPSLNIAKPLKAAVIPLITLLSVAAFAGGKRSMIYLSSVNIGELENAIYTEHQLSPAGTDGLLLIDHDWSWTKGELILGQKVNLIQRRIGEVRNTDLPKSRYAILPTRDESQFQAFVANGWTKLKEFNGFLLFKNPTYSH